LHGKSCLQIRFMARTAELKAVMIDPPFLPTTRSPIRQRPGTFVAPTHSTGNLPHPTVPVIFNRLADFRLRIHHKRSVARDRFVQGHASDE